MDNHGQEALGSSPPDEIRPQPTSRLADTSMRVHPDSDGGTPMLFAVSDAVCNRLGRAPASCYATEEATSLAPLIFAALILAVAAVIVAVIITRRPTSQ
jgi:hypothetical protein